MPCWIFWPASAPSRILEAAASTELLRSPDGRTTTLAYTSELAGAASAGSVEREEDPEPPQAGSTRAAAARRGRGRRRRMGREAIGLRGLSFSFIPVSD